MALRERLGPSDRWSTAGHPEAGATSAEYAVLVSLIAIVIAGAVAALGWELDALFSNTDLLDALTP